MGVRSAIGRANGAPAARLLIAAALPAFFLVANAVTYSPMADGDLDSYLRLSVLSAGLSLGGYGLVRLRAPFGSVWPLAALASVLLVGVSLHAGRVLHPVGRGAPFLEVREDFRGTRLDEGRWRLEATPPATLSIANGAALLTSHPRAGASLELVLPDRPAWWLQPPVRRWLPAAFDSRRFAEVLEWQARVERHGTYFVVLETERLLVQMAPYGLHLTYRDGGGGVSATEVTLPGLRDSSLHIWQLTRRARQLAFRIDSVEVWTRPTPLPLGRIRFGETRSDELHGGKMELRAVRYGRWWDAGESQSAAGAPAALGRPAAGPNTLAGDGALLAARGDDGG